MTNEERIDRAKLAVKAARDKRRTSPPSCRDCAWCYGTEPGYSSIGKGNWCRNPVVIIDGNYDPLRGTMREAVNIDPARNVHGECGPDALFFEPKNSVVVILDAISNWITG